MQEKCPKHPEVQMVTRSGWFQMSLVCPKCQTRLAEQLKVKSVFPQAEKKEKKKYLFLHETP